MAKVILICGKICSGKTTYAHLLRQRYGGALLSVDEIMLAMFGQHCGERHDEYAANTQRYLFAKSAELAETGIDVILDWGFWTKAGRDAARAFYRERDIPCEFHAIDIPDEVWHERLKKRNAEVRLDPTLAYYVDENLAAKFGSRFEMPDDSEIDVWVRG
ncbi:MAG: ATP-binding protein [Clostridia bacterium]|nr:ATP-binding protein [Clostridia bacterium]MBQ8511891.1 ATP-binding protein [Clostridia bacterium]